MYMDHNELRPGRDYAQGELYRLMAQGGMSGADTPCRRMTRGCNSNLQSGDCHGGVMPRGEGLSNGNIGMNGSCGCEGGQSNTIGNSYPCGENGVEGRSLAMVYAPLQAWRNAYDPGTALHRGTLFRELDMPFMPGGKSDKGGNCRGY